MAKRGERTRANEELASCLTLALSMIALMFGASLLLVTATAAQRSGVGAALFTLVGGLVLTALGIVGLHEFF